MSLCKIKLFLSYVLRKFRFRHLFKIYIIKISDSVYLTRRECKIHTNKTWKNKLKGKVDILLYYPDVSIVSANPLLEVVWKRISRSRGRQAVGVLYDWVRRYRRVRFLLPAYDKKTLLSMCMRIQVLLLFMSCIHT